MNSSYEYFVDGCASSLFPCEIYFAFVITEDGEEIPIFKKYPFSGKWGITSSVSIHLNDSHSLPQKLDVIYLSLTEKKFYSVVGNLNINNVKEDFINLHNIDSSMPIQLIIGMSKSGLVAVWLKNEIKSYLLQVNKGKEIPDRCINDFLPSSVSLDEYCNQYRLQNNDTLLPMLWMKQYVYRYQINFEVESKEYDCENNDYYKLVSIKDYSFDGSYDKTGKPYLLMYHCSGMPKIINITFESNKTNFLLYLCFNEGISLFFEKFYGAHPETKTDFIISIDAENKKYELALYRQGLKEPVVIPESAYQLIVFKNKFEDYRSENYNQPRGAWIW